MRVLIDANVLVSAIYSPKGTTFRAFEKAVTYPYQCLFCDYCIDELRKTFKKKWPHKVHEVELFIQTFLPMVELILTPSELHEDEEKVGDVDDRPILRAAINAEADIIVTGDHLFASSDIEHPKLMKPAEFLAL